MMIQIRRQIRRQILRQMQYSVGEVIGLQCNELVVQPASVCLQTHCLPSAFSSENDNFEHHHQIRMITLIFMIFYTKEHTIKWHGRTPRLKQPLRDGWPYQNGWIFGKIPKRGGGGSFPIQKFILQIFAIINGTSVMNSGKNLQYDFPKMRGGQRPCWIFPKIHPFW